MNKENLSFNSNIKSRLYGEIFANASRQQIIEEVEEWKSLQVNIFWENLREIKKDFCQNNSSINFSFFVFPRFESAQQTSNFWDDHESFTFTKDVDFSHCHFVGEVDFSSVTFKKNVNFSKVNFKGDITFYKSIFEQDVTFEGTQFREESNFYYSMFKEKATFDEATFHTKTVFHKATFLKKGSFSLLSSKYRLTFFDCSAKKISFKYSRIENAYFINNNFEYLNLHGVAIQNPFFSDNIIEEAERETFAYMKHFFDTGDDFISANYYYAKEMSAYQKQLFPKSNANFFKKIYHWFNKPNLSDKLVFGFSKLASNFGQNIFLPFYWIVFAGAFFVGLNGSHTYLFVAFSLVTLIFFIVMSTLLRKIFKQKKREDAVWILSQSTLSFVIVGLWLYGAQFIGDFAKVINPIHMLRGQGNYCQGIELSCLMLRVFIATMVYHFIIATKRGVKR